MCLVEDPLVLSSEIDAHGKVWGIGLDRGFQYKNYSKSIVNFETYSTFKTWYNVFCGRTAYFRVSKLIV
jgi:hypothetical protein